MASRSRDPVPMEQEVRVPTKRVASDLEGNEAPDTKRNRAPVNMPEKLNMWAFLIHAHEAFMLAFGVKTPENIDTIADITSVMLSLHTRKRQELNGRGGVKDKVSDDKEVTIGGVTQKIGLLMKVYIAIAGLFGIAYEATEAARARIGMLSSFLGLVACFRDRFNEVRVGITKLTMKKTAATQHEALISRLGFDQLHQVTLSGANYTPSKQSALKASLGPMTVAVNLALADGDVYKATWKKVFCHVFKLVPNDYDTPRKSGASELHRTFTELSQLEGLVLW